ncbi:MAG TPA: hypothetical protein VN704_02155 [Verrucomicrobiae bacterium]|nr:hypothetical protein [Verrucomicrobiae bacterium]
MQNSTIAQLSIFTILVLISGIFSMNGYIYAQKDSNTFNNLNTLDQILHSTTGNGLGSSLPLFNNFHKNPDNGGFDNTHPSGNGGNNHPEGTVTRDMVTLLLEGKTLNKGDYISVYDSTPYKIATGHLVAKVPCTVKSQSQVKFLIGVAPNLQEINPELVASLSTPGKLCLYHVDLVSDSKTTITDVAIKNNSTGTINFPSSSSVGVGVDKIAPLPQQGQN